MPDIINIDVPRHLKQQYMQEFLSNQPDDTIVTMYIADNEFMLEKQIKDFRSFFEDENIEQQVQSDECIINFITDTKILTIAGLDYNWWIAPIRNKKYGRLKRLFATEETTIKEQPKQTKKTSAVLYKVAVGKETNDGFHITNSFEGKYKDMLNFVNKERNVDTLRTFFKSDLMYCINYDKDLSELTKDDFKTFEQLVDEKIFIMENENENN